MRNVVQCEIFAELAQSKGAVVASSDDIYHAIRAGLKKDAGPDSKNEAVAALGCDLTMGNSRRKARMHKQRKRVGAVASRRRRMRSLAQAAGSKAATIARTGLRPAALYGTEVYGMSDSLLLCQRRTHASAVIPRARGRSLTVTLAINEVEPAEEATAAPIVRWAKEVWHASVLRRADVLSDAYNRVVPKAGALTVEELCSAWTSVQPELCTTWAAVTGPITAAHMSMVRIGWQWSAPMRVVTDLDVTLNFGIDAPRLIEMHVKQSVRRQHERYVAASLQSSDHHPGHRADLLTPTR